MSTQRNGNESARPAYFHRGGERPLVGDTVDAYLRRVIARHADRDALVSIPQDRRLSYAELDVEVERLARGLLALDVRAGDRVGIWSTNNIEWVLLHLATSRVGAVLVNVNPAYKTTELGYALKHVRVQTLFVIPAFKKSDYVARVLEVFPGLGKGPPETFRSAALPDLRRVVVYDPANPMETRRPAPGFLLWREVLERGEKVAEGAIAMRARKLDCDDPINIQFTSGTTGFPKAVVLTHHNVLNNALSAGDGLRFGPEDRLCVPLPFYHCFGMVVSTLGTLSCGAALVIPAPHFDPGATLHAIARERCTAVHGVPTMFLAELEHEDFAGLDVSSLRTGIMAGAPCPPELVRRVMEEMGCREILIGYGQTEASPLTHLTRPDDSFERRVGTVGANVPHQEVKIVEPATGARLTVGQQGEICVRGYQVMREYYADERATREAIDQAGWLHTGDLGVLDEDGYLAITGRLKDMILRGGENVYPAEIEAVLYEHPDVAEAAVFGVPDERLGEEVACWIQLREGQELERDELLAWASERMAHYKVPRHLWLVDEFPMTATGKIQKFRMRDVAAAWLSSTPDETPAPVS